jgi:hypothetical protein
LEDLTDEQLKISNKRNSPKVQKITPQKKTPDTINHKKQPKTPESNFHTNKQKTTPQSSRKNHKVNLKYVDNDDSDCSDFGN